MRIDPTLNMGANRRAQNVQTQGRNASELPKKRCRLVQRCATYSSKPSESWDLPSIVKHHHASGPCREFPQLIDALTPSGVQVDIGTEPGVVLLDIGFTESDPQHGFLTGTKQTLLETFNGGKTWEPRYIESVDEEGINYRYNSVSFHGDEGWMVGKPGVCRALRCLALPRCRPSWKPRRSGIL